MRSSGAGQGMGTIAECMLLLMSKIMMAVSALKLCAPVTASGRAAAGQCEAVGSLFRLVMHCPGDLHLTWPENECSVEKSALEKVTTFCGKCFWAVARLKTEGKPIESTSLLVPNSVMKLLAVLQKGSSRIRVYLN